MTAGELKNGKNYSKTETDGKLTEDFKILPSQKSFSVHY